MNDAVRFLQTLWRSYRINPFFVAAYSAAAGAIASAVQDELASGRIDWTRGGVNKLCGLAVTAAIAAVVHLYCPAPGTNPTRNQ